jgi:excisionase family DNA binding protein
MIQRREHSQGGSTASGPADVRPTWVDELFGELAAIRDALSRRTKSHMTVDEVAEAVGRSAYTIRRWIAEGRIAAIRVGGTGPRGRLLVAQSELERIIHQGLGGLVPTAVLSSAVNTASESEASGATGSSRSADRSEPDDMSP